MCNYDIVYNYNIFFIFINLLAWMLVMGIMITMVASQIPYYLPKPVKILKWNPLKQVTAEVANSKGGLC